MVRTGREGRGKLIVIAVVALAAVVVALRTSTVQEMLRVLVRRGLYEDVAHWPKLEHVDLRMDLSNPPELRAEAEIRLSKVRMRRIPLMLNSLLTVDRAEAEGRTLEVDHVGRWDSLYHEEAQVVYVDLGREPSTSGEEITLELEWSGTGYDGSEGRDWRGVMMLAPDELRMAEQAAFYPQFPYNPRSPGVQRSTARVEVLCPKDFEVFVPGLPCEDDPKIVGDARSWCFQLSDRSVLNLFAAVRVRQEIEVAGLRLTSLLRDEHAKLGPLLLEAARRAYLFYSDVFGPIDGEVLGICEIDSREYSYNWASQGIACFDRRMLSAEAPVKKVGREVAHLWFGQAVIAIGSGEPFLTEGLAEYASWRFTSKIEGEEGLRLRIERDRANYIARVHETGEDAALSRIAPNDKAYTQLAYTKGALVLRYLESILGRDAVDRLLREYIRRFSSKTADFTGFRECLEEIVPEAQDLLPWLRRDGHAHLKFAEVGYEDGKLRGRIQTERCPAGILPQIPPRIAVRTVSRQDAHVAIVAVEGTDSPFEIELLDEPDALVLDPELCAPIGDPEPYIIRSAKISRSVPRMKQVDVDFMQDTIELHFDRRMALLEDHEVSALLSGMLRFAAREGAEVPSISAVDVEIKKVTLRLDQPMVPGADHILRFDGLLEDFFGVPLVDTELRFHTRDSKDREPPTVLDCVPALDSVVPADLPEIRITFSETMLNTSSFEQPVIDAFSEQGWAFPLAVRGRSRWEDEGRVFVFSLEEPLVSAKRYLLALRGGGFQDIARNKLLPYDLRFSTQP